MSKDNKSDPFYMTEADADAPVLPEGTDVQPEDREEGTTLVDIGHIETDPKIS